MQYFAVQVIVMLRFMPRYSMRFNTISDLGNTMCGIYDGRSVCSPLHTLMNISFIILGITMFLGAIFHYKIFKPSRLNWLGFTTLGLAGIGTVLVGAFPENTISALHVFGAAMPFLVGNAGMVLLSYSLDIPRPLRVYTFLSGALALTALVLFTTHHYLGLGTGGMERLTAYPQTLWLIVFGTHGYFRKTPPKLT
ncbi:MAG: hypothetical protein JWO47_566 [Candidatus Saccharibacteria bacterium]|nr:hypothetical protein [Candidatus Saccharibacteria bacterium]